MRDYQRQRLYNAEQAVRRITVGDHFADAATVQEYIIRLEDSDWFKARFPNFGYRLRVTVNDRMTRYARGGYGGVEMPHRLAGGWAWNEIVVLHEVAHNTGPRAHWGTCEELTYDQHYTETQYWGTCSGKHFITYAAHGPEFARDFLDLVHHQMGPEAADRLAAAFAARKVKVMNAQATAEELHAKPRHKVAIGEVIQTRIAKETGTTVTVTRVAGGWEMKCVDHNTAEVIPGRLDAEAHAAHPTEWCPTCAAN